MSWKKHFRIVNNQPNLPASAAKGMVGSETTGGAGTSGKYSSFLPEIYAGHPNRIQRYYQYDDMDRDSDINAALDTIADFCTQSEEQSDQPFLIHYTDGNANETEVTILKEALARWTKIQDFRSRLWTIFRNCIKNGDAFFLRDPETFEWLWIDHFHVEGVKVDDEQGKTPEEYMVRGLDYNRQAKFGTKVVDPSAYRTPYGQMTGLNARPMAAAAQGATVFSLPGANRDPRAQRMLAQGANEVHVIDAQHVVHLSLSSGMNPEWPFGQSVLEPVFKTFKQKELLEDSIIIYRVQRAPERRIFYIDVGAMPPARAKAHIEAIKNEIHQRRIPNRTGGGTSILDAAYNPLCLAMDTKVPLLDGRTLTIAELADEYRAGKENWVYSTHPVTGEIMPGNITWAGVTRRDAKVIRLHLDNGETLTCTPDHKIPVLGRGFVEAQHLTPNDSLIAFNTREKNVDRRRNNVRTYTQVYDHSQKEWVFVHRMVGDFFRRRGKHQEFTFLPENKGKVKQVVHHKDYNRYNNDPRNLVFMNRDDHVAYHVFSRKDWWGRLPEAEADRIRTKISTSLAAYYADLPEDARQRLREIASERNTKWIAAKKVNDPEGWKEWRSRVGSGNSAFFRANPEAGIARAKKRLANGTTTYKNQSLVVTQEIVGKIVDLVKSHRPTRIETARLLTEDAEFMATLRAANPPLPGHANKIDYDNVSPMKLDLMIEKAGYAGWRDFTRKIAQYNHRVVRIEQVSEPMDVGTITVDGQERWHDHHTFALSIGIFVKNSIVEDYFFAQGAEGRGSKVETLPGGDQTGEITDLTFFTKKMFRALRVPPSYMSYGDDEGGSTTYNDGKLGAALIQEFRFNKYCMRLQALLAHVFDREFKKFVAEAGIEVDESIFELRFNPPQNFGKYREIEVDTARVGLYSQVADNRYLSNRFKLKKYLGLTEEEVIENEKLWREENAAKLKKAVGSTPAETDPEGDLGSVGLRPPSSFGDFGLGDAEEPPAGEEGGEGGDLAAGADPAGGSAGNMSPVGSSGGGGDGGPPPPSPVTVKA